MTFCYLRGVFKIKCDCFYSSAHVYFSILVDLILYLSLCLTKISCEDDFFIQISSLVLGGPVHSLPSLPPPYATMTCLRDFVAELSRVRKSFDKSKESAYRAFRDKSLHKSTINTIINKVKAGKNTNDQRHLKAKMTRRTQDLIAAVASTVDKDAWVTVQYLTLEIRCLLAQFLPSCMGI